VSRAQRSAATALAEPAEDTIRGAPQTRDLHGLWRSRISGAPLRALSRRRTCDRLCARFALHRIQDTPGQVVGRRLERGEMPSREFPGRHGVRDPQQIVSPRLR
jgi:hypothetical protein